MKRLTFALAMAVGVVLAGAGARSETKIPTNTADASLKFEVYKDAKGDFRWRLKATNSKTIADSGEGYKSKADCLGGIKLIQEGAAKATIDEK